MPISKTYMICTAYESGVGHGVQDDGLCNPYPKDSEEYEAYGYGVKRGLEMRKEREKEVE